ncbi:MAG: aldehyde dehydrogenase family protein [Lentisphaeria bacterium]|nr:aldehyde dehydrogenase family protein [Candidatus Neomarinimicrobiota bacterium]MCF7843098.1 aldehyde dehydrogenase family protein [Lentisphaeria bacterium]
MDKDLQSIQEVRELVTQAKKAQQEFQNFTQAQVDQVARAMADAGFRAAESLAKAAVDDTGFGHYDDKIIKNQFATRDLWNAIKDEKTVGVIHRDHRKRTMQIAEPMGIVAAIIPTTNPTSTVLNNLIISVKAGNGVVASPHPSAAKCTLAAVEVLVRAAEKAGAPEGLIGCIRTPSIAGAQHLMTHDDVNVIIATGGRGIVKAAYSSGKPAYGVGPGNVPAIIERSADVSKAVKDIIAGKTFDNGVICSSEQAMIYERSIERQVMLALKNLPVHIVNDSEKEKLRAWMFTHEGKLNGKVVGLYPWQIGENSGFKVDPKVRALLVPIESVGPDEPFSKEKLSPVLAMLPANTIKQAFQFGMTMVTMAGIGHTAALHTRDDDVVMEFAHKFPVGRLVVNSPSVHGSVGYTTELPPALTLGSGTRSGSITMENISAKHLVNVKSLAYETKPLDKTGPRDSAIDRPFQSRKGSSTATEELPPPKPKSTIISNPTPATEKILYGSSGLTDEEVEKIIRDLNS